MVATWFEKVQLCGTKPWITISSQISDSVWFRMKPLIFSLQYNLIRNRAAFKKLSLRLLSCTVTKFTLSSVIQASGKAGRCDGCLREGEGLKGKKDGDNRERRVRGKFTSHLYSYLNLSLTLDYLWRGWDRASWRQHAKHCVTVKLQNQSFKLRHALSLNMITWSLWMDNPLMLDQRMPEFWSGLQYVFTRKRSWYG